MVWCRLMGSSKSSINKVVYACDIKWLFFEHDYIRRVVKLVEDEIDKFYGGRQFDLRLLGLVLKYLVIKSRDFKCGGKEAFFVKLRKDYPKYSGSIDDLLIDYYEVARLEAELRIDVEMAVNNAKMPRAELFERLSEYCWRRRLNLSLEQCYVVDHPEQFENADFHSLLRPDPLFGDDRQTEFDRIYESYLDHARRISLGNVPYAFLEVLPAVAERAVYTGIELSRLPKRLFGTGMVQWRRQWVLLNRLPKTKNIPELLACVKQVSAGFSEFPKEYLNEFIEALQAIEAAEIEAFDSFPQLSKHISTLPTISFKKRRPRLVAGISWQAVALNMFLRGTVKQLMGFVGTDYAEQAKGFAEKWDKVPNGCTVELVEGLGFPAERLVSSDIKTSSRIVMYLPGGGFFFPAIWAHKQILAQIMRGCRADGLIVHYRLAPENPFPASLDDALTAYRFLLDKGFDSKNIVVAGDSAGGGLTLSLLLALKDAGLPQPVAVALLSPMSDLSFAGPSRASNRWLDPMLPTRRKMKAFELYTGDADPENPLLSPVFGDFTGCAPMFAQVGSTEILLDDTLRIAARARECDVDFELEIWEGLPHVWHLWSVLPETHQALTNVARYLNEHLDRYS